MRYDGLPKVGLSLAILGLTILMANSTITRMTPDAPVYQVQLLGKIMLVCPETFDSGSSVDCNRWLRGTRGGSTVFLAAILPPGQSPESSQRPRLAPRIATVADLTQQATVSGRIVRPRPRPEGLAD